MQHSRFNWVHLDLKGIIPSERRLLEWIDLLASWGFGGIVWEYENRLPWRTWPGTFRPGYDLAAWRRIWQHCRQRGLEVVPLVQTQGHLEWLLRHERYAAWREAGHGNELCPQHPAVRPALTTWLDEVMELHPESPYAHLGCDETWFLGSCPACLAAAQNAEAGKLAIYLEHVGSLCRHVLSRGRRPMIWADMFWREKRIDLAAQLPPEVILVDWHYEGTGPFATTTSLAQSGHMVWGASAIRCSFDTTQCLAPLVARIENVRGHRKLAEEGNVAGLIHTVWGRSRSLLPLYGPWEGWLPAFLAAGNPAAWKNHPWRQAVAEVDRAMTLSSGRLCQQAINVLHGLSADSPMEQAALDWWRLALQHRLHYLGAISLSIGYFGWRSAAGAVGLDHDWLTNCRQQRTALGSKLGDWEQDVRGFWQARELSDGDEFLGSRAANLRYFLQFDWASQNGCSRTKA